MKDYFAKKKLSLNFWFLIIIALLIAGLLLSGYLAFIHFKVYADIDFKSLCAISKGLNCDTVSQSKYSLFLGLPVAVWGVLGYAFYLSIFLLFCDLEKKTILFFPFLLFLSIVFSLISIFLGVLSSFYISAYCIFCAFIWLINISLLIIFIMIRQGLKSKNKNIEISNILKEKIKYFLVIFFFFSFCVIALKLFYPHYWEFKSTITPLIHSGVTEDGYPWIGSENPEIEIIEYSDYMCFQCKKMHFMLREFISNNPQKIRLIHKNFPMDHNFNPIVKSPYHVGAGEMALLANYSVSVDKFWEMNDFLYNTNRKSFNLKIVEDAIGISSQELYTALLNKKNLAKLKKDILEAVKLGIEGTPCYYIDGQVFTGNIPECFFKK